VPAVFVVGQSFSDYVLAPYLVGRRVHLNPVWVMFALFAFGYLFGFIGLLIAVPVVAAIGFDLWAQSGLSSIPCMSSSEKPKWWPISCTSTCAMIASSVSWCPLQ
jgi:hypothetical protein